ncbi:TrbL/VirB6 plasmid conjugal transfer protein [Enhydrobacter aerosaccus]|uniref:TrbL/VirB6 plasmid conjugal transfer protein n=1 Tax=Enhydrobacter aerosaccus TaxID=225324 RepID=A0A1T4TIY1_9HYPH|nr:type IV secretion system protein [Enhydrobacter aerosaccus]SKA40403.1 TrbL/VirB6 plasmid conjugal transfer protein [Enhydrobacter aerosaccus]
MKRTVPLLVGALAGGLLWAPAAWAQTTTGSSTVFGRLLASLLSAVNSAIAGPIGNLVTYVGTAGATFAVVYVAVTGIRAMLGLMAAGQFFPAAIKVGLVGLVIGPSAYYQKWVVNAWLIGNGGVPDSIAAVVGGTFGASALDALWGQVVDQIGALWDLVTILNPAQAVVLGFAIIGLFFLGVICCSVAFIEIAMTQVGMAMVLMVGPLFIVCALFGVTQRWFYAWAGEVIHYAIRYVLIVVAGTLSNLLISAWTTFLVGKVGGTFLNQLVFVMYVAVGCVVIVFIYLQAGRISRSVGGGSAMSGLEAGVSFARRLI